MPKSIVFGANGYLGRHLCHFLRQAGHHVIPTSRAKSSIDGLDGYQSIDVNDSESISKADLEVDYVFVFAGMTGTNKSFDDYRRFIDVNEKGLLNILNYYKDTNAKIIFPSTRLVYAGKEKTKLDEESEKQANTIYAQNKLSCEAYLNMYQKLYGLKYNVFRICVPYGNIFDGEYSYGTIGFFLKASINSGKITLFGDGSQMRTFTHVEDICKSIITTIPNVDSDNQIFNIGSDDNSSLFAIAKVVAKKYNAQIENIEWPAAALALESGDTIFDDRKILGLSTYKYLHNFNNWIESL